MVQTSIIYRSAALADACQSKNASDIETVQPCIVGSRTDKEQDTIPAEIRYIVPFAGWIERHPRLSNIGLALLGLALAWVVLNYEFTTRI